MNRFRPHPLLAALFGVALTLSAVAQPVCSISLGADVTICDGETTTLTAPNGYPGYLWSTGAATQSITVGTAGDYWGEAIYTSANLVTNGDFSAGNTGFTSQWIYNTNLQGEGTYYVDNVSTPHHPQFSGTGNGAFMMVNAGWGSVEQGFWDVWCQSITVCPEQTYTLSYQARTLSNAQPARLQWYVDGTSVGPEVNLPAFNAGWATVNQTWTSGAGQTNANVCIRVMSGDGVGNDFGLDGISISGTIRLRDHVHVNVTPLPIVDLGPDQTLCQGTPLPLDATVPGGSYLWQDNSTAATYNVTAAGNYSVTVTANGCSNSDGITVAYNPYPVVDLGPDQTLCAGEQTTLDATTPGGTYSWQNNSIAPTFNVTGPGNYDVDVTVNGCTTNDEITINYTALPVVDLGPDQTLCGADPLLLDATVPGGSYLWQDNSAAPTLNVTTAGNYSVTVTANGCSNSDAIAVAYNPYPVVDIGPDVTLCDGEQTTLDASTPGAAYLWQDGSTNATFNVTSTGTYDVDVTVNGCTTNDAATVSYNPMPVVDLGPDAMICEGDLLTLDATLPGATYLWQDGSTNATFDVTASGNFSVQVTLNGCVSSDAVNVTAYPVPVIDFGPDITLCDGEQTLLDATTAGATYLWQDGSTAPTYLATSTSTYDVDVTVNGCTTNDVITVTFNPVPTVDLGPDMTICQGDPLQLDATSPGATYLWQDASTNATLDVTSSGTYSVDVFLGSCWASDVVNVMVNPAPIVDLGPDATLCTGDALLLDATTAGATYLWQDGSTAPTFNVTATGTYDVDVTVSGCTTNDAITVTFNPVPTVDLGPDMTICQGDPLQLDATSPGATYLWQDASTNATLDVTSSGTYSVDVFLGSCWASDVVNVMVNPAPIVDLGPDATLCTGDALLLDATTAGATYLWQDGNTAPTFNVTATGTYDVDVTVNGCTTNDAITVTFNPVPTVDLGPDMTICQGDPLQLDATSPGATYLWQDASTNATLDVTSSGTYSVDVFLGSCWASDVVNVMVNLAPIVDLGPDQAVCPGAEVTFDATVPGGSYLWQDGNTGATFTTDQPGTYSVTVTANGCAASDAVTLNNIDLASVDLGPDQLLCQGSTLLLDATLPGSSYLWNTSANTPSITVSTAGTYWVQVSQNGCSVSDTIVVTGGAVPVVDLGNDTTLCSQATLLLSAVVPGSTYHWTTGNVTSSILINVPGTYGVTVDLGGCTAYDEITVDYVGTLALDLGPDATLCPDDGLQLTASIPGGTTVWSTNTVGSSITVSDPGIYWATITVSVCSVTDSITIAQVPLPPVDLGPDAVVCEGDAVSFDITVPGASYLWDDGSTSPVRSVDEPGLYWARVMLGGCLTTDTFDLTVAPLPIADLGPDLTICQGDPLQLDASSPGASYLWQDGSTGATFNVIATGTYSVQVSVGTCAVSDAVDVTVNPTPIVDIGPDLTLCDGEEALLDATTANATYLWQDGSTGPIFNVSGPGTYAVNVTVNGCTTNDAVTVAYTPLPTVDLGPDTGLCAGATLPLNAAQPGASYLWNNNSTAAAITAGPGDWSVMVTVNGCSASDAISIAALPMPVLGLPDDTTLCDGTTWTIDFAQPGASYLWQNGSTGATFLVQQPGTYGVTVSLGTCTVTDDVDVGYFDASVITLGNDTTLCPGEALVLALNVPGAQLTWPDGSNGTSFTVTSAGTYTVQANAGGCLMSDAINVAYTPLPVPDLGDDRQLCEGDSLVLAVVPQNASVLWSGGGTADSLLVTQSAAITVTLALDGCVATDAVNVVFLPVVEDVDLGPDATICLGAELVLDATTHLAEYVWNTGDDGPAITVTRPGTYQVTLTGPCIHAADTIMITEGNCAPIVYVPNAFTPDGDGTNEVFAPVVSGSVRAWAFRIFDRWGEAIYSSATPGEGWDGTLNGTPVQDGVYVWQVEYKAVTDDGVTQEQRTGSVTLLR